MAIFRYIVYARYQHYGKTGKEWTKWFKAHNGSYNKTEIEGLEELSRFKESSKNTDKSTKLKHEFELRHVDVETLPVPSYRRHKRGRKSKEELKLEEEYYKNYWKEVTA